MKKILILIIFIFTTSCSIKLFEDKKNITLYNIDVHIEKLNNKKDISIENISSVEGLNSSKILYKEGINYGYFQNSKWICSTACMFKNAIIENFSYIRENSNNKLDLIIFNFEPHFNNNENYVYLKIKAKLKRDNNLIDEKIFEYKLNLDKITTEEVIIKLNKLVELFLTDLDNWLATH